MRSALNSKSKEIKSTFRWGKLQSTDYGYKEIEIAETTVNSLAGGTPLQDVPSRFLL